MSGAESGWGRSERGTVNYQTSKRNITSIIDLLWLSESQRLTGRISGITQQFSSFDASLSEHKKTLKPVGLRVREPRILRGWLEQAGDGGDNSLSGGLVGGVRIDRRGSDALVAEGLLDDR